MTDGAPAAPERERRLRFRRPALTSRAATTGLFLLAAMTVAPRSSHFGPHFARAPFGDGHSAGHVRATASIAAFGRSGGVKMLVALPATRIEFPLVVSGDPAGLRYQWVRLGNGAPVDSARTLTGAQLSAPLEPGFYRLALVRRDGGREVLAEPTLGVLVPFERKLGGTLNGYRVGTYLAERLEGTRALERPAGFLEVGPAEARLRVSEHLTLADFITRDDQGDVWPKYVALSPQLLDKIELVVAEVRRWRPKTGSMSLAISSGFRTPAHNRRVLSAARDSRHQFGDAADVSMDADGDGRITAMDGMLVALAVEMVEMRNPELVGGLGLYTSRRYRTPYVHIDARGRRSRWRS